MKGDSTHRRQFLRSSIIATAGAALSIGGKLALSSEKNKEKSAGNPMQLSDKSVRFMKMMEVKYPIIQAPTGGIATPELAVAIAEKGALGALPLTWTDPDSAFKEVKTVQRNTQGAFFANFLLHFEPKSLDRVLQAGIKIVQFSWGIPTPDIVDKLKNAGVIMGIQVTSEASALAAIRAGADYLVCQGTEAGGHVHASRPLAIALERVLRVAGDTPVAASGGIATGTCMRKYLNMGAAAVVMGSRFVASKQSSAHDDYKQALVSAKNEDTVFTVCLSKGWPNATHRILRNNTFEMWEAAGCPVLEKSPGIEDVIANYSNGNPLTRYNSAPPTRGMTGDVKDAAMYAGEGVDFIHDIPNVSEIIDRVWYEFQS